MSTPLPSPTMETRPYWQASQQGRLAYQTCEACGQAQFPPSTRCLHCGESALVWKDSRGAGAVASFTVVHRAPTQDFRADAPYVLALVDFDEGFRVMMNVRNCEPDSVRIGTRVSAIFEPTEGEYPLPQAVPA